MPFGTPFLRRGEHVVQEINERQASEIAKLHNSSFPRAWHAEEVAALMRTPGTFAYIVQPVGKPDDPPSGFVLAREAADEAEILTLAVSPKMRRKNLGWQLMEAAVRHLRADGISRLFLEVSQDNEGAVQLYRKIGFAEVGKREGYYEPGTGGDEDQSVGRHSTALVMRLDIS